MALPRHQQFALALFCVFVGIATVLFAPVALPTNLDFSQLYISITSVYQGAPLYNVDPALVSANATTSATQGHFPSTYPPWYITLLLPLGLLSAERAALAWCVLNVTFLCSAIFLITPRASLRSKCVICVLALLNAPVQGHLIVGQFTLIILLGLALTVWGTQRGRPLAITTGLALTTFKPHLGFPFIIAFLIWTGIRERSQFPSRAARFIVALSLLLAAALLSDPTCLTAYPAYLQVVASMGVNQICDTCSSLTIFASRTLSDYTNGVWSVRFLISITLSLFLIGPLALICKSSAHFIPSLICAILLCVPYIRNYDYVLMIAPLAITWLNNSASKNQRARLACALVVASSVIAGVLPYFSSRQAQGSYLWLAALTGYVASLVQIRTNKA